MKKTLMILIAFSFIIKMEAQSLDEKVEKLMIVDGTMGNIENLITETIDYQKQTNPTVSENFWTSLNIELQKEAIPSFTELVSPIYKESFSENQIDELIKFYTSEIGKELVSKQPELIADLNLPIMQWSQNVNSQIIDKIENRGNEVPTTNEIEKFEQEFKNEYGLQIMNLTELTLDKEHNPGTLLIDFGESDGIKDVIKKVVVKNKTDSLLSLKKPFFQLDEDIIFDWGDVPLKPKEERALKFILNSKEAEGNRYSFMSLRVNQGEGFPIGIKYSIPQKELEYTISQDSISFERFSNSYSQEYEFVITNIGAKRFRISDIELDQSIAFIHFDREMIEPNENSKVKILFTKELILDIKKVELNLKIKLSKSEGTGMSSFPSKTIKVKIN